MKRTFAIGSDTALVAEIDVKRELAAEGWISVNMNTEKGNFPNVDLLAVREDVVHYIQVKASYGETLTPEGKSVSHPDCLFLGRAEGWLTNKTPFFNGKPGPLMCSIVVAVHVTRERSRFVVLPVGLAEKIARTGTEEWYNVPKKNGGKRKPGFDARPRFISLPKRRALAKEMICMDTLRAYENRWDVLLEEHEKLRD